MSVLIENFPAQTISTKELPLLVGDVSHPMHLPGNQILGTHIVAGVERYSDAGSILSTLDRERAQGISSGDPGSVANQLNKKGHSLIPIPLEPGAVQLERAGGAVYTPQKTTATAEGENGKDQVIRIALNAADVIPALKGKDGAQNDQIADRVWSPDDRPITREQVIKNELDVAPSVREASMLIWAHFKYLAKDAPGMEPPEDQGVEFIKWLGTKEAKEWIPDFKAYYVDFLTQDTNARDEIINDSNHKISNPNRYNEQSIELSKALVDLYRYRSKNEYFGHGDDPEDISVDRRTQAFDSIADLAYGTREAWEDVELSISFNPPTVTESTSSRDVRSDVTENTGTPERVRHKKLGAIGLRSLKLHSPRLKLQGRHSKQPN